MAVVQYAECVSLFKLSDVYKIWTDDNKFKYGNATHSGNVIQFSSLNSSEDGAWGNFCCSVLKFIFFKI